jgi:hypothetical protein
VAGVERWLEEQDGPAPGVTTQQPARDADWTMFKVHEFTLVAS